MKTAPLKPGLPTSLFSPHAQTPPLLSRNKEWLLPRAAACMSVRPTKASILQWHAH